MAVENKGGTGPVESRPGFFVIGSPNVGKRTLLSRLLSIDFPDTCDLSSGILCQGWTIDTKYYSADLSVWTAHLDEGFSFGTLSNFKQLAALVMVFDMNDGSSFLALQNWVAKIDIKRFEILLCIGNKADLVPGHYAHREYRRHMQKHGDSAGDPHPEYLDYGIDETEGCSLLVDEEPSLDIRKSWLEWCCQNNIEYIEACASNADFDKCLSVDGDIQGVERLHGALSAHMWPGMTLKSGNRITAPSLVDKEETTDDESDYDFEYEVLSHGSDEPWDNTGDLGVTSKKGFASEVNQFVKDEMVDGSGSRVDVSTSDIAVGASSAFPSDTASESVTEGRPDTENRANEYQDQKDKRDASADQAAASEVEGEVELEVNAANSILEEDALYGLDDLEKLMSEIGNMRENLRLMPDFQRREMAAKLAMKMAAMFGDSSDEDGL
ncbi:uncharacterized protein LOC103712091 [Phoenix dactylifera]|uniref:Uncharacterized protein LOC103712091 n=1 Tax=Phoenix dactylifera TaxID=42345 RepID=A0A8B7CD81_PHODC|nr:uncharacterized protein LOC103712091 [Phoenix dactylifera]XP_008796713.1 uncharacterized protein LOC103712091 [Phoenix dactylifera]XP_026662384.1 uncharacterized protein LOC103712091 [Phoenix dactylifera]XP_026662385.1 uncharacterized protein LOC103712091 [Phoenix dactylifera]